MTQQPTEDDVLSWFTTLSNWGRWGADDERGTLNLITDDKRRQAASLVQIGRTLSLARDIRSGPRIQGPFGEAQRFMLSTGQGMADPARMSSPTARGRTDSAMEYVGLVAHGLSVTHLDSLAHVMWDGQIYGGRPAELVNSWHGATVCDVTASADGIVTRGVLLDVAHLRGVDRLDPAVGVLPEDLEEAERAQGVRVGSGDAVLLRTGCPSADVNPAARTGFHAACLPWFHEREAALIGCDVGQEVTPSGYPSMPNPVHIIGIVAMGLSLLDNCELEALHHQCLALGRYDFCLMVSPLRIKGVTGSPVNPLALL
jgi:kynurenine formamidase